MAANRQLNTAESPQKPVDQQQITTAVFKNKKSETMVYAKFKRDFE